MGVKACVEAAINSGSRLCGALEDESTGDLMVRWSSWQDEVEARRDGRNSCIGGTYRSQYGYATVVEVGKPGLICNIAMRRMESSRDEAR